jgi:hypothetical protein
MENIMARPMLIIEGLDTDAQNPSLLPTFDLKTKINHGNVWNIKMGCRANYATPEILREAERRHLAQRYFFYNQARSEQTCIEQGTQFDFFQEFVPEDIDIVKHLPPVTHEEICESQAEFINAAVKSIVFDEEIFSLQVEYANARIEPSFEVFDSHEDLVDAAGILGHGKQCKISRGRLSNKKWTTPDGMTIRVHGCSFQDVWT